MDTSTLTASAKFLSSLSRSPVGQLSAGLRLGFQCGFDSGELLAYVEQNRPSGRLGVGWVGDWLFLNQTWGRAWRHQRTALKRALRQTLAAQRLQGLRPFVADLAAGSGRYLVELLAEDKTSTTQALALEANAASVQRGEALAHAAGVKTIRYQVVDGLEVEAVRTLLQSQPQPPTVVVASGLYEFAPEVETFLASLKVIRQQLALGGTFLFTTAVSHPHLARLRGWPNRHGAPCTVINRPVAEVENWAREAGFNRVDTQSEPARIFSLSIAE